MSEYGVDAYFLELKLLKGKIGSNDQDLLGRVLADESKIIASFSGRFSGKTLVEAVTDLLTGDVDSSKPFHYGFALWATIATLACTRPHEPSIGYPFIDLYDLCEALEEHGEFPEFLQLFQALNGSSEGHCLPTFGWESSQIPCFAYLDAEHYEGLDEEIEGFREAIQEDAEWLSEVEELEDVERILDWVSEGVDKQQSSCLVLEGNL